MDQIWRNAARKTCEHAQQATKAHMSITAPTAPTANSTITLNFPHLPAELKERWKLKANRAMRMALQNHFYKTGKLMSIPIGSSHTVINQATQDMITTNTSIEQHDLKLCDVELAWCRKKSSLFPDHIRTTFASIRSHLKAHDVKRASRVRTATRYELADFEGTREGENEKKQREEREEMEKEMIGKGREEEKREEEEEQVREEGDEQTAGASGDTNDVDVMSQSADHLHSTTTIDRSVGPHDSSTPTTSPEPMPTNPSAHAESVQPPATTVLWCNPMTVILEQVEENT